MLRLAALAVGLSAACVQQQPCDGFEPVDGVVLDLDVVAGGGAYEHTGGHEPITTEQQWQLAVDEMGADPGLSPDFQSEAVLVYATYRAACGEEIDFFGWRWDSDARVRAEHTLSGDTCDLDHEETWYIVVDLDGATSIEWCE